MGALYSTLPFLGGTHHQARLEWIDHRNIKGAVLAIGPEGDQNIRRLIITARQEASWLFHWPAQPAAPVLKSVNHGGHGGRHIHLTGSIRTFVANQVNVAIPRLFGLNCAPCEILKCAPSNWIETL